MAHYAFLDENNIVTQVIPGRDEDELDIDWEAHYEASFGQVCKRTSYNTYGNAHKEGKEPFRKNYAGLGFYYDETLDGFIAPQCHHEAVLNRETCLWECFNEAHTPLI